MLSLVPLADGGAAKGPAMLTTEFLWHNERFRADKPAMIDWVRRLTNAQLASRVRRLANALRGLGIRPGEHVATLANNSSQHMETVLAISATGAAWVPLNTRLTAAELSFIIEDSEAVALIYSDDMQATVQELDPKLGALRHWIGFGGAGPGDDYEALVAKGADRAIDAGIDDHGLFALMYTSGTTGLPKGVMLPHRAFALGAMLSALTLKARENDVMLQMLPQFHAGGQIYQMAYQAAGATIVAAPGWDEAKVFELIETEGITIGAFVPAMLTMLLEAPGIAETDFSGFERVMYGAAPIAEDRLRQAMERTGAGFQQTYGLTETGVLVSVLDETDHRRGLTEDPAILRSCGRAVVGYDLEIAGDGGDRLPVGEVGELIVRSETLMSGYWKRPDATTETLVDGWLHTGDLAWRDEAGRFYVVGRKKEMIISGGENVYPVEVENVVSAHPDVLEVAVIGVPDDKWGEAVKAVVVPREGCQPNEAEIVDYCQGKLAGFKRPRSVDFIDKLPRNASGKITKKVLMDKYWTGRERRI